MPTMVDAAGRRKVRCPKCTAVLTEPQTQIYECPICLTLLLAKGNPGGKLWEDRAHKSDGDADDIQQTLEGGSKVAKATLVHESGNISSKVNVSDVGFDGRSRTSQEGQVLSDSDNPSLSGISFAKPKAEPINDLTSAENNALAPDTPPDTPHHRKSPHAGEISSRGGSGQRSPAELDSASHSESEVESSLWSSENANFGEVPDVPSGVSSFEAPSLVAGSSEHLITSTPRLSSGAASNDGARGLQEESKLELRKPPDAEREERHHPYEVIHEKRQNLESRVRNPDASVISSSGMSVPEEAHNAKNKNDDDSSSAVAQSPQRNVVNSTPKENAITDSKQQKNVENRRAGGRFGLFDLSVFGIYSEDTYSELMRGTAAHYPKLSESSSDGKGVQSTVDGEPELHSREVATESSSHEQDPAENCIFENTIAEVQKISDIPESITDGTHGEAGSYGEAPSKDREHGMGARSSGAVGQEVDDGSNVSVGDVGLRLNSSIDSDTLANSRYGDHVAIRDLSVQMGSSVDISFGDWQLQQVVKPSQTYVDAGSLYEREMPDVAAGEGSDSSWDDEELTFSSTLNEESKLKGTTGTEKETEALHSTRTSIGGSQAKALSENPAFPFRTTAMQKFLLQRNEQEGTVQIAIQESIKADSRLYEASYVEHYTLPQESNVDETAAQRTSLLMPESNTDDTSNIKEDEDQRASVQEESVDIETRVTEHQHEDAASFHSMGTANVNNEAVRPTLSSKEEEDVQGAPSRWDLSASEETASRPLPSWKEKDMQLAIAEDSHSRVGFNAVRSPLRDNGGDEADRLAITEVTDLNSQKVDYLNHSLANKVGTAPGKPASLKWKGRSSTQSLSSTEDEGAYGVESEAGSGPDRDSTKKQGFGLPERHGLLERETQLRLDQPTRGQYQPAHRSWVTNVDADRQKHGSGELTGSSRRSARSRAANARLSSQESFEQVDAGRMSNLEAFGRSGMGMAENVSALQGPAVKLNKSMLDQGSNYSYNGTTDYNSDHSSRSQNAAFRPPRSNETYLSNPYGLPAGGSTQAYPLSSHGSIPRAPSQEPGFMHSAHLCASPACSLCMQQQYYMQPPQMIQNLMMHPCAACASQASAAGYHQPLHHGVHSHHMHGSPYSNLSLGQHGSGSLPGRSQRQNRSKTHQSHPLPLTRRRKLYPPLPGKDAPPYVLCKHCNQLLQVPGHLPPTSEPIQKLQCGSCDKISKFSVHLQAGTPLADTSLWATSGGLTVHASDKHLDIDKRHTDTSSMHSSEWISSGGFAIASRNSYTTARQTSGHGSQQEWVENRMLLQSSASGTSQTENVGLRHHVRPMQGGVPEQYRGYGRHVEGEHLHTNTGAYSEGSLSSSPSSPSGSSPPGRPPLRSRQPQQVEPVRQRSPGFGDGKLRTDSPTLTTPIREQGRPSRYSYTGLQGAIHDSYSDSPRNQPIDRLQQASKAGSWRSQPEEADYSGMNAVGSRMEHRRRSPAAPGSPLVEHFPEDAEDVNPMLQPRQSLQNSGNGAMSAPWSPGSGSPVVDSQDASTDSGERFHERERPPLPAPQDASKGSKPFAGLFKRSTKGGQGGRKVLVNGHVISEAAVRKAEELAGPIHSGSYWYDYRAGFWGVLGSPCSGILMPFIEEFHFPLSRDCAGGSTGVLVNGRELHEKDLEVLAKRGMPRVSGKAYRLDIRGLLLDDVTGQPLKGLGKLAPSIEKKGRGFGMSQFTAPP